MYWIFEFSLEFVHKLVEIRNIKIPGLKNNFPFLQMVVIEELLVWLLDLLGLLYHTGKDIHISWSSCPCSWLIIIVVCKMHVMVSFVWLIMKTLLCPCDHKSFVKLKAQVIMFVEYLNACSLKNNFDCLHVFRIFVLALKTSKLSNELYSNKSITIHMILNPVIKLECVF